MRVSDFSTDLLILQYISVFSLVVSALQKWTQAQIPRKAVASVAEGDAHLFSGGSLLLTCDVPEDPSPLWTFEWFFNGKPLASGMSYQIWKARVLQSGNYTCMAVRETELNPTGILETQLSAPLRVDIDGGWIILEAPSKPMIMEETMSLTCRIRGHRRTEVIFYLNGREIWRQRNRTLTLHHLTLEHGGQYSCRATWEVQGLYHSAESTGVAVTVLEILTTPQLLASTIQGRQKKRDLKLTCVTEVNTRESAAALIHYYFLKNDMPLGPATSYGTFIIPDVSAEDSGQYSCRVSVPMLRRMSWSTKEQVDIPRSR
ncbi:high affinity immunoglobulin gamma Fc receptor I-like isoform X1 [Alosa alosa]|uniref:high affinity immunoglobulin gamma Fc receptor I-like isoform X1 n=1 Tax=Alosa alosa TaxID=278164 RepID=UPI0020154DE6|nr:high affinity immunoglobulin gamma Fc receptor I-like isoform X1 [Alosa alosa]XP_048120988.1 high affinity immunoglobulin gamma Fc receptor I-like isoform X1 [Alosa alosa]XP_048120989.1 high affinity immunoglobulin gamma Fc receptor I-like isoform X1 [Alosa alosa]